MNTVVTTHMGQDAGTAAGLGEILTQYADTIKDFHLDFPFETEGNMSGLEVLKGRLRDSLPHLDKDKNFARLLYSFIAQADVNFAFQLDALDAEIEKSKTPDDDLGAFDVCSVEYFEGIDSAYFGDQEPGGTGADHLHKQRLTDFTLAYLLSKITNDRLNDNDNSHPQNFRHILSYFSEKKPEFLLIFDSMIKIILGQDRFAIQERGRASRALINNYYVEELFIHISSDRRYLPEDKAFIYSWLMAYQKLYRKILEVLYDKKTIKEKIAQMWFKDDTSLNRIMGGNFEPDYKLPQYIRIFTDNAIKDNIESARAIGRHLMLTVNNEDIIRVLCGVIHEDCDILGNLEWMRKIYRVIYEIICEYRKLCIEQAAAHPQLKTTFAAISRERRIAETIISPSHKKENRTPIVGKRESHKLLDDTRKNLEESSLKHLFEVWPIPEISQMLFNQICQLRHMIPQDTNHLVHHFLYREKILEFLMQIDRVGLKVGEYPHLPLITNAYQLNSLGLFKEGIYMGSTGHWKTPIQKPPSILCCTNPHSIGNCRGQMLRHVVMRVFLGTGEFYESPFVLDSTLRYGQWDEEGGVAALVMRPGLFLIEIPPHIIEHWTAVQKNQMKGRLGNIVADKIRKENTM